MQKLRAFLFHLLDCLKKGIDERQRPARHTPSLPSGFSNAMLHALHAGKDSTPGVR
jgi:hypothetical protein